MPSTSSEGIYSKDILRDSLGKGNISLVLSNASPNKILYAFLLQIGFWTPWGTEQEEWPNLHTSREREAARALNAPATHPEAEMR